MKVSIIVPVLNNLKLFERSLQSMLRQSFDDYEIIVIDDGSTDDIASKVTGINRVTYRRQAWAGASAARNAGAKIAKGDYQLFCDADVLMRRTMLAKMSARLDTEPDKAFVYSAFRWGWKKFRALPFDAERLKDMNYISTMSMMRRQVFPGFDETLKRFQDWDLWLTIVARGGQGAVIPNVLFRAVRHGDELSQSNNDIEAARAIIKAKHQL